MNVNTLSTLLPQKEIHVRVSIVNSWVFAE